MKLLPNPGYFYGVAHLDLAPSLNAIANDWRSPQPARSRRA
jgi:hypothetical protein